jgi:hypothetical protein
MTIRRDLQQMLRTTMKTTTKAMAKIMGRSEQPAHSIPPTAAQPEDDAFVLWRPALPAPGKEMKRRT